MLVNSNATDGFQGAQSWPSCEDYSDPIGFNILHKISTGLVHESMSAETNLDPCLVNAVGYMERTPLHWAVGKQNHATIDCFLTAGADINAQCSSVYSVLHYAVSYGSYQLCQQLLELGALVSHTNSFGQDALHIAATRSPDSIAIVRLLLHQKSKDYLDDGKTEDHWSEHKR